MPGLGGLYSHMATNSVNVFSLHSSEYKQGITNNTRALRAPRLHAACMQEQCMLICSHADTQSQTNTNSHTRIHKHTHTHFGCRFSFRINTQRQIFRIHIASGLMQVWGDASWRQHMCLKIGSLGYAAKHSRDVRISRRQTGPYNGWFGGLRIGELLLAFRV